MKLLISKNENDIITKIIRDNGETVDFTNLEMIDYLYYNKAKNIEFEFDESISDDEQLKIKNLFEEIYEAINKKDDSVEGVN